MNKINRFLFLICLSLISANIAASANTFIRETERLIALSDKTYTVIVNQYEQTFSYWTGINRLMVRVIDTSTHKVVSEVLLSSIRSDREMEEPFESTHSLMADEPQAIKDVLLPPQTLYKNLEYPKFRFRLDSKGVYLENEGRQDILEYSVVQSRFAKAGSNLDHLIDANFDLKQAIDSNDIEFTGWYKANIGEKQHFFFALKVGRFDDDTGGLEYIFSIPDAE